MEVGKGGSLVEEGDGGLGIFGSLEGTLAFEEDGDDFRVILTLEYCPFFDGSLAEVGEEGLGVFVSLEVTFTFGEYKDGFGVVHGCSLKEALAFEDCAFFI